MDDITLYTTTGPTDLTSSEASVFIAALLGIIGVFFVLAFILYLFNAYGMYKLAENYNKTSEKKIEYTWLAWIPIACNYFLGVLLAEISTTEEKPIPNEHLPLIFLVVPFVASALSGTDLAFISIIANIGISVYASYLLASRYSKNKIVGIILGSLFFPFYIFALRKAPLKEKESFNQEMKL